MTKENSTLTKENSNKPVDKKTATKATAKKVELQPRIHFNEFIHTEHADINDMEKAGFKTFAGQAVWKRPNEWRQCFKQYENRNK